MRDNSNPPWVRGLANIGLAKTAEARGDSAAALRARRETAESADFPIWVRDVARRHQRQAERSASGAPAPNPSEGRTELPKLPNPAVTFYVSPVGNENGDGSKARPFASLVRARDAIRALKKSRGALPAGGVVVSLTPGTYRMPNPLRLGVEDSGTAEAPVVYRADSSGSVVFEGGMPLRGWKTIVDPSLRDKLDRSVHEKILEADLKFNGVSDWGDATALKRRPELFVNGAPQTLARWPNEGFVKTGEVLGTNTFKVWDSIPGCKDGRFRFVEDRPKRWVDEPDVRLYGYWFWDWFEEYQKVAAIDAAQSAFTLAEPYSAYGYRKNQRYFAVNVFRELDQPGEFYLDRQHGKVFWFPPPDVDLKKAEVVLSVQSEPFLVLDNVQHVSLLGLTLQDGRGDGIHVKGGSECLVAGCTLRRLGGDAILVDGGRHHTIFGCTMNTLGCGGMRVNGGDRRTLTPGNHTVENCTVSDISRIKRTYAPAVHMDGCGNRVAHNLFERIPSSAMRIEGNDHLIELNRIRNVVQESDDQGGIDMFGNPLYRGVVIRWNHWSDITGGTECGAAGIRLDDMISGILVQGNIFERCGAVQFGGVQVHGGKENVLDGNVFIDCFAALSFSRWDEARWNSAIEPFLKQAAEPPYATRYPDLARLKSNANVNFITRNVAFGCRNLFLRDGGVQNSVLVRSFEGSVSVDSLPRPDTQDLQLRAALLDPIPVGDIGPYPHPLNAPSTLIR